MALSNGYMYGAKGVQPPHEKGPQIKRDVPSAHQKSLQTSWPNSRILLKTSWPNSRTV